MKPESKNTLLSVARNVTTLSNGLLIEGNTDNLPIHTAKFPSNWVLSATRAINVVEFLINSAGAKPEKLSAVGYVEYRPIVANDTEANRAKNRRVDIVFLLHKHPIFRVFLLLHKVPKPFHSVFRFKRNNSLFYSK